MAGGRVSGGRVAGAEVDGHHMHLYLGFRVYILYDCI